MRRVLAISLAILAVTITARGVMAQDVQKDGNDLLLKILKEKNIINDAQFQEIKGQLAQEQGEVDQKLTALDRSISDYLAKSGDSVGGNTSYVKNQGVTFSSGDGMWSIYFGGLFQFGYAYGSGDTEDPHGGFGYINRLDFGGTIFDPNLQFYTQVQMTPLNGGFTPGLDQSGSPVSTDILTVLDAYLDWQIADGVKVKAGKFKVPYGRQSLVDESDRAFGMLNMVYERFRLGSQQGRDTGVMLHGQSMSDPNDPNGLCFEWATGIWNGMGNNFQNDTWLAWGARGGVYPFGAIPYVEGDWNPSQDVKVGLAGSFVFDETHANSGDNPKATSWELDGVLTWNGLYFTAEYFSQKYDTGSNDTTDTGWYAQGGYFLIPSQLEILASYGTWNQDSTNNDRSEWAIGGAYYFDGHEWKVMGQIGQRSFDPDVGSSQDNWFIALILQAD